ncbi:LAETG motif-containing sortase-dependent surface protein [Streptomyces silvisoli]|uniref:LAETG motif-containing sortase-dependent surface protein n=1 Tax=Streptomyces silvisoli TaxID=3034235 RepID=A0ABT5ZDM7_9ACTN|nr:LAETG motif-containing sortase-dependent surface protein [Streptomyces silvisoli]MDF3287923.1 LAETG motif-containing sortase-dependent surface protein [Streptomyces silvisoli]
MTPAAHKDSATADTGTAGTTPTSSTDDSGTATGAELAATGANPATPWALGGGAVALTAGAGLVLAARRRSAADR